MKSVQSIGAIGLIVVMVGCASRPSFPFFAKRDRDTSISETPVELAQTADAPAKSALIADVQHADTNAIATTTNDPAATKLVSAMSSSSFTQPTLMTLPKGADLNAQISAASGPVVLDFYADWCVPCQTQGKILHEMEDFAAANNTQIIKVNFDEHKELAKKLKVSSLPTIIVMKDGQVSQRVTGLTQRDQLEQWIKP